MSLYQSQKAVKPKIEDVAGDFLDAERTADLLNIVEFIRANKIRIQWVSVYSWALLYKGKRLGFLKIYCYDYDDDLNQVYEPLFGKPNPLHKSWFFCHRHDYLDRYYSMKDCDLKSFIFDNMYTRNCGHCFGTWKIKGNKEVNELKAGYMNPASCGCWPLRVYNPSGETLELTKRLIEFRMNCILEEKNSKGASQT